MGKIKKCNTCKLYTFKAHCGECGGETADPGPPSFSFPDAYGEYRRETKQANED